jgi:hypothetical protein
LRNSGTGLRIKLALVNHMSCLAGNYVLQTDGSWPHYWSEYYRRNSSHGGIFVSTMALLVINWNRKTFHVKPSCPCCAFLPEIHGWSVSCMDTECIGSPLSSHVYITWWTGMIFFTFFFSFNRLIHRVERIWRVVLIWDVGGNQLAVLCSFSYETARTFSIRDPSSIV